MTVNWNGISEMETIWILACLLRFLMSKIEVRWYDKIMFLGSFSWQTVSISNSPIHCTDKDLPLIQTKLKKSELMTKIGYFCPLVYLFVDFTFLLWLGIRYSAT